MKVMDFNAVHTLPSGKRIYVGYEARDNDNEGIDVDVFIEELLSVFTNVNRPASPSWPAPAKSVDEKPKATEPEQEQEPEAEAVPDDEGVPEPEPQLPPDRATQLTAQNLGEMNRTELLDFLIQHSDAPAEEVKAYWKGKRAKTLRAEALAILEDLQKAPDEAIEPEIIEAEPEPEAEPEVLDVEATPAPTNGNGGGFYDVKNLPSAIKTAPKLKELIAYMMSEEGGGLELDEIASECKRLEAYVPVLQKSKMYERRLPMIVNRLGHN